MEPEIQRGDVLLAIGPNDLRVGDIVVYQLPHVDIPIVHRIIKIKDNEYYLTQGDNNNIDDRQLYLQSYKDYLPKSAIIGKVRGHIPWIGHIVIIVQQYKLGVIFFIFIRILYEILFKKSNEDQEKSVFGSKKELLKYLLYPN